MAKQNHLITSALHGVADLKCPSQGITIPQLAVKFDPQTLEFELFLNADEPQGLDFFELADESEFALQSLKFSTEGGSDFTLYADEFFLQRRNALSDWLEFGGNYGDDEKPDPSRRLVLEPFGPRSLKFLGPGGSGSCYQVLYCGWGLGSLKPTNVRIPDGGALVRFDLPHADRGFLCVSSESDFSSTESRIRAALSLAQGANLRVFSKVNGAEYVFHGISKVAYQSSLSMLIEKHSNSREFVDQLLSGMLVEESEKFEKIRLALGFFLLGKQSGVVEQSFLQAMICVEAMDDVADLQEQTTAALLGVSATLAKLLNCMRNKLVHGYGGYRQAFGNVLENDFKVRVLDLTAEYEGLISDQGELQFSQLWFLLLERLDAFWCGYLGVNENLLSTRNTWGNNVVLRSAIDASRVLEEADSYRKAKLNRDQEKSKKCQDLLKEIKSLRQELDELRRSQASST